LLGLRGSSTSFKQHIRLAPFVAIISVAQKTRVDLISIGFTSYWHKIMNVNDFPFSGMTRGNMSSECGGPGHGSTRFGGAAKPEP